MRASAVPTSDKNQIQIVTSFFELTDKVFEYPFNARCWQRTLTGDFAELVHKLKQTENVTLISPEDLLALNLSAQGQLARAFILEDMALLQAYGAAPILNLISHYERDVDNPFFPTDVYSFHVDRAPLPSDTYLCTYYGASSEILPNAHAEQKINIPEIRTALRKEFNGSDLEFEDYLTEHFYDLHYQARPEAEIINLGIGHLWRLAADTPNSKVPPCIHRAPIEKDGELRLLLIC